MRIGWWLIFVVLSSLLVCQNVRAKGEWTILNSPANVSKPPAYDHHGDQLIYALWFNDLVDSIPNSVDLKSSTVSLILSRSDNAGLTWRVVNRNSYSLPLPRRVTISDFHAWDDSTLIVAGTGYINYGYSTISRSFVMYSNQGRVQLADEVNAETSRLFPILGSPNVILTTVPVPVGYGRPIREVYRVNDKNRWDTLFRKDSASTPANAYTPFFRNDATGLLSFDTGFANYGRTHLIVLRTTTAGRTWDTARFPAWRGLRVDGFEAHAVHGSNWVAKVSLTNDTIDRGTFLRSSDDGLSWIEDTINVQQPGVLISSAQGNAFLSSWQDHKLRESTNDGASWQDLAYNLNYGSLEYAGDSIIYGIVSWRNLHYPDSTIALSVSTNYILFDSIDYGQTNCKPLSIYNSGGRSISFHLDATVDSTVTVTPAGDFTLAKGDSVNVTICYSAKTYSGGGTIVVRNAGLGGDASVSLYCPSRIPRIVLDSNHQSLSTVGVGDTIPATVKVSNLGRTALRITQLEFPDHDGFSTLPYPAIQDIAYVQGNVVAKTAGLGQTRMIIHSNDPITPRDTITFLYNVINSASDLKWASHLVSMRDSLIDISSISNDVHGGVILAGSTAQNRSVAMHLDSNGSVIWAAQAGLAAKVVNDGGDAFVVAQLLADSIEVRKLSFDGSRLLWDIFDSGLAKQPLFLARGSSGKIELATGGFELFFRHGFGTGDLGSTLSATISNDGTWQRKQYIQGRGIFYGNGQDVEHYGNDYPLDLALDSAGNRYDLVALADSGMSHLSFTQFVYDTAIVTASMRIYRMADRIATDPLGNIYALSRTNLAKYRSTGQLMWEIPIGGHELATDVFGNCFVLLSGGIAVQKLDSNGRKVWDRWNPGEGYAIRTDGVGDVYVMGLDVTLSALRYTPTGDCDWVARYNGLPLATAARSMLEVDGQGSVFIGARAIDTGAHTSAMILRFTPPRPVGLLVKNESTVNAVTLSIYPNPATSSITIDYHASTGEKLNTIIITDMSGRDIIRTNVTGSVKLSTTDLTSGVYEARVLYGSSAAPLKFCVIR
jgi:hypothetical protein